MVHNRSASTRKRQDEQSRQRIAAKEEEEKKKPSARQVTGDRTREGRDPSTVVTKASKPTININAPPGIKLNEEPKLQDEGRFNIRTGLPEGTEVSGTPVAIGAGIGGALAIANKLKAVAIGEGTLLKMGTHIPTRVGLTKLSGKASNLVKGKFVTVPKLPQFPASFTRIANNAKNYKLKVSYLTQLASKARSPGAVLAVLGTLLYTSLFWGPNEKGDALFTYVIAQRDALEAGDIETVEEINEIISDTAEISASIPVIGFIQAELAKVDAALTSSEAAMRAVEELKRDREGKGEFDSSFEISSEKRAEEKAVSDAEFKAETERREGRQDERDAERKEEGEAFDKKQEERDIADRADAAYFQVISQLKEPFPEGTEVNRLDPELVRLARTSNRFIAGVF